MPRYVDPLSGVSEGLSQAISNVGNISTTLANLNRMQEGAERIRMEGELFPLRKQIYEQQVEQGKGALELGKVEQALKMTQLQNEEKFLKHEIPVQDLTKAYGISPEAEQLILSHLPPDMVKDIGGVKYITGAGLMAVPKLMQTNLDLNRQVSGIQIAHFTNKINEIGNEKDKIYEELEKTVDEKKKQNLLKTLKGLNEREQILRDRIASTAQNAMTIEEILKKKKEDEDRQLKTLDILTKAKSETGSKTASNIKKTEPYIDLETGESLLMVVDNEGNISFKNEQGKAVTPSKRVVPMSKVFDMALAQKLIQPSGGERGKTEENFTYNPREGLKKAK